MCVTSPTAVPSPPVPALPPGRRSQRLPPAPRSAPRPNTALPWPRSPPTAPFNGCCPQPRSAPGTARSPSTARSGRALTNRPQPPLPPSPARPVPVPAAAPPSPGGCGRALRVRGAAMGGAGGAGPGGSAQAAPGGRGRAGNRELGIGPGPRHRRWGLRGPRDGLRGTPRAPAGLKSRSASPERSGRRARVFPVRRQPLVCFQPLRQVPGLCPRRLAVTTGCVLRGGSARC